MPRGEGDHRTAFFEDGRDVRRSEGARNLAPSGHQCSRDGRSCSTVLPSDSPNTRWKRIRSDMLDRPTAPGKRELKRVGAKPVRRFMGDDVESLERIAHSL